MNTVYRSTVITLIAVLCSGILVGAPAESRADDEWIREAGDILQIALPVIGGGSTFFTNPEPDQMWDKQGTKQFVYAYGTAWGSTYLLKLMAGKMRPNGDNRTSFPSGHTMSAFAGAGFIDSRYGKNWGIPALLLAGFTGYSRVHSQWHYADDVLAGASIGLITNWIFVDPQPGKFALFPTVSADGLGVQVKINGGGGADGETEDERPRGPSFVFWFGPAKVIDNHVRSIADNGTPFNLADLEGINDPTTTASVSVGVPVGARSQLLFNYAPFEARDRGSYDKDIQFGGELYPAGTNLDSAWRFYDIYAGYFYKALDNKHWWVDVGACASLQGSYAALSTEDQSTESIIEDIALFPELALALGKKFGRFGLEASGSGFVLKDEWILDAGLAAIWRMGRAWDIGARYSYFSRKIETSELLNEATYNVLQVNVSRYW